MRILLAIGGSTHSREAVEEVRKRPWPAGSVVKVISVVSPTATLGAEFAAGIDWNKLWRDQLAETEALVEGIARSVKRPELAAEPLVRQGDPRREIISEARDWQADLIVVGSQNHSRLERLLRGSVGRAIVNRSPCSVEVVRARAPSTGRLNPRSHLTSADLPRKRENTKPHPRELS